MRVTTTLKVFFEAASGAGSPSQLKRSLCMTCAMATCVKHKPHHKLGWPIPAFNKSNKPSFHLPVGIFTRGSPTAKSSGSGMVKTCPSTTPPGGWFGCA
eukprot:CAMPEP_0196172528 /NCGR_PEP_ID=MMETSP0911-20130528/6187_1 /TAXON_ID=49265 /ORGANISM="Thalassiosira rotula, Strain GSO102" /LENGTH=98 /DNA_ID=CAMNT_0041439557 /DNA_START=480 /DNA_END=776 /DNA_ORIENTATION=-